MKYGNYRAGMRSPWIQDHKIARKAGTGLAELETVLRHGHPGYSWAAVMDDGELICAKCLRENYREVYVSTRDGDRDGWTVIGAVSSGDCEPALCADCNRGVFGEDTTDSALFLRAVSSNCDGLESVHPGEGPASFSSCSCDSCGTTLAGDRETGTGLYRDRDGKLQSLELELCTDCVMFHANGELPEVWQAYATY